MSLSQTRVQSDSFFNTSSEAEVIQRAQRVIATATKKSISDESRLSIIEDFVRSYNGYVQST